MLTNRIKMVMIATSIVSASLVCPLKSQELQAPEITAIAMDANGFFTLDWAGADKDVFVQYSSSLDPSFWQELPGEDWPIDGNSWSGKIPVVYKTGFFRLVVYGKNSTAVLPSKTVTLDLIGTHNPTSANYSANCISCHGDRTGEVALDGTTPMAHNNPNHEDEFGSGNEGCISCHEAGPNFLTYSSGGLREQVSFGAQAGHCLDCHNVNAGDRAWYAK